MAVFRCNGNGSWIHQELSLGSLFVIHDGLYMPEVTKDVCSADFMFFCTNSGNRAKGTVVEKSVSVDNYRGEILGGLMVQLVL